MTNFRLWKLQCWWFVSNWQNRKYCQENTTFWDNENNYLLVILQSTGTRCTSLVRVRSAIGTYAVWCFYKRWNGREAFWLTGSVRERHRARSTFSSIRLAIAQERHCKTKKIWAQHIVILLAGQFDNTTQYTKRNKTVVYPRNPNCTHGEFLVKLSLVTQLRARSNPSNWHKSVNLHFSISVRDDLLADGIPVQLISRRKLFCCTSAVLSVLCAQQFQEFTGALKI